jgi:hypothetical protein
MVGILGLDGRILRLLLSPWFIGADEGVAAAGASEELVESGDESGRRTPRPR